MLVQNTWCKNHIVRPRSFQRVLFHNLPMEISTNRMQYCYHLWLSLNNKIRWNHRIIYPFVSCYERSIYSSLLLKILLCHQMLPLDVLRWMRRRWYYRIEVLFHIYMDLFESKTFQSTFLVFILRNVHLLFVFKGMR